MYNLKFGWIFVLAFLGWSCANQVAPTGGPRDTTPPGIDTTRSTPNNQVNFNPREIRLTFDEWVVLEDATNQIVVSPPLEKKPDIKLIRKTLLLTLDEEETLRENTTYTINFGEAIKDLHEKNPAKALRYVFSTRSQIDSLTLSGQVLQARTNEPAEGVLVMLYDNLSDTIMRKNKPVYFAKTDAGGTYKIENIKEGTYQAFALKDANTNYLFDQANELFAFPDTAIAIDQTDNTLPTLYVGQANAPLAVTYSNTDTWGVVKVLFNRPAEGLTISTDEPGQILKTAYNKDTLNIWHQAQEKPSWKLYLDAENRRDTITVRPSRQKAPDSLRLLHVGGSDNLARISVKPNAQTGFYQNQASNRIIFNQAIQSWDTSRIQLLEDTLLTPIPFHLVQNALDTTVSDPLRALLPPNQLLLEAAFRENIPYKWVALPGAFTDFNGKTHTDTLALGIQMTESKAFATLLLEVTDLDPKSSYIAELLRSDGSPATFQQRLSGKASWKYTYRFLEAGAYRLRITKDNNANGRWDTVDFLQRTQPEPVLLEDVENLRANWELEMKISGAPANFGKARPKK